MLRFLKIVLIVCLVAIFGGRIFADETNSIPTNSDAVANGYVQIQAQLHATQLQIEQSREEEAAAAQRNADAMNARIAQLEQAISTQRAGDVDAARRTQQLTLYLVGSFGFAGLLPKATKRGPVGQPRRLGWFAWHPSQSTNRPLWIAVHPGRSKVPSSIPASQNLDQLHLQNLIETPERTRSLRSDRGRNRVRRGHRGFDPRT